MKNLFVKQTEVNNLGGIRISVYKQMFDGDRLVFEEPHQIVVSPLDDMDAIIAANNEHLATMGYPPIAAADLALPVALRKTALSDGIVSKAVKQLKKEATQRARAEAEALKAQEAAERQAEADAETVAKRQADAFQAAVNDAVAKALAAPAAE